MNFLELPHMSIGNLTPNKLHNTQKIKPTGYGKTISKKLNSFEKENQNNPVNLLQDLSINL